jgi:uncharacterized damage-inducible protein DinB
VKAASPLGAAFLRNNDANLFLLRAIPDADMGAAYSARTRTVAAQFAHMHYVRVLHLRKRGKEHLGDLQAFPTGAQPTRKELERALTGSAKAIVAFLAAAEEKGAVKSWHDPPAGFLAYLVAHEAHHRALAILSLRLAGRKLHKDTLYGIWNWSKKGAL